MVTIMPKERVDKFKEFERKYQIWRNLQRKGADHISSPCCPIVKAKKDASKTCTDILRKHPDFHDLFEEKKYFEKIFREFGSD